MTRIRHAAGLLGNLTDDPDSRQTIEPAHHDLDQAHGRVGKAKND